jgi:Leucine-rich repeat (LRR) protein
MMKSLFWRILLGAALFSAGCIQTAARALSSTQASEMADGGPLDKPLFTFTIGDWEGECGQNAEGRFLTLRKDGSHHMLRINEGSPGETSFEDVIRLATAYMRQQQMFDLEVDENATLPTDRRQQERAILVKLYFAVLANETDRLALTAGGNWLSNESVCNWVGVSCGPLSAKALPGVAALPTGHDGIMEPLPQDAVTAIQLPALGLKGTLPSELGLLEFLYKIRLDHNRIKGTIPESLGRASSLRYIDLSSNRLDGSIPTLLGTFEHLQYLSLGCNFLTGTILEDTKQWTINLQHLDLSENAFGGTIHPQLASYANIRYLVLDDNYFTGTIPSLLGSASEKLEHLDMASNLLTGTIPSELSNCQYLQYLVVGENLLTGTLPSNLFQLSRLHALILSDNLLHGKLPTDDWASMTALGVLYLQDNHFTGTLPPGMFQSEQKQMRFLDVSRNHFRGTIPRSIGQLTGLRLVHAAGNRLAGTLPAQLTKLHKNLRLNFTDNLITGRIPSLFCGQGSSSLSLLYHDFGCDAVLCPAGTFNRYGHATLYSGCRACLNMPLGEEKVLGRISCEGVTNVHGDLDGDGVVSQREVLRLLYINTIGRLWGKKYQKWALMDVNECDLEGVVCVRDNVAKIDLQGAELCKDSDGYPGSADFCLGVPTEIGLLSGLEIFQLSRQGFLRGNIPTEIGHLTKLRQFDVSSNPSMSGTIPTEVGKLTQLVHFLVSFCTFTGSMPSELFLLTRLERMQLTDNDLTGTFPDEIHLSSLKELMTSRNFLSVSRSQTTSVLRSILSRTLIDSLIYYTGDYSD